MTMKPFAILTAMAVGASLSSVAYSQSTTPTPPPPCSSEEFRQLDFWVGDWNAEWDNGDGTTGTGENHITRDEFGDCVIYERFSTDGFLGMSVSTYHVGPNVWRQSWIDNSGGYFALVGGPAGEDDDFDFLIENTRILETAPYRRMIWEDVTEDSFVWRWQGRTDATEDWADLWVINYSRMEE